MKVGVIGGGYIGARIGEAAANSGKHEVWIYDNLAERCAFREPGGAWEQPFRDRVKLIVGLALCEIFLICVSTPEDGPKPVADAIRWLLFPPEPGFGKLIVIESSVPPGFTREQAKKFPWMSFAHSPERIWPGHEGEWPLHKIPKLVGGMTPAITKKVAEFYRTFIDEVIECSSPEVTAFAKLYENTQRTANIAFANWAEELAEEKKIDFQEVLNACGTKPFGYSHFHPGTAGGSCLPSNAAYLEQMCGQEDEKREFIWQMRHFAKQI